MFGDLMGMMGKLKDAQKKVEATKKELEQTEIIECSSDGLLGVKLTATQTIKSIDINEELMNDREQLEDYLVLTLNKAIANAKSKEAVALKDAAKDGLPNIPGMDGLL